LASDLLIATRSADKLAEIKAILGSSLNARLLTLQDVAIAPDPAEDAIEAYATFLENAVAKARYFARLSGLRVLADDSGLAVFALGGAPGVRSRRFAIDEGMVDREARGNELDEANNDLLLQKLAAKPDSVRTAHYVCAAACADPTRLLGSSVGTCSGRITHERIGMGGFGYDPLFLIPELGVTFAQLTPAQKNTRSHRAIAMRALVPLLR